MAQAKIPFRAGLLMRGQLERSLKEFLEEQIDMTYDLKTLHKGWLSTSYVLVIKGPEDRVRLISKAIVEVLNKLADSNYKG